MNRSLPPDPADTLASTTELARRELFQDRWHYLGAEAGITHFSPKLSAAELKKFTLFAGYTDEFLDEISQDISVAKWKAGSVLFEEGSYVDLAFFIASGSVDVYLHKHSGSTESGEPIFDLTRSLQLDPGGGSAQRRQGAGERTLLDAQLTRRAAPNEQTIFLSTLDFDLPKGRGVTLGPGDIFGELSALNGWPQPVTARASKPCELVQIRMPALRKLRSESPDFKAYIDRFYREHILRYQLRALPLLQQCDESLLESIMARIELVSAKPDEVLAIEGDTADSLLVVRSGFVRLTQSLGGRSLPVTYLSKGMTFGEAELLIDELAGWTASATSVGYSELIRIPLDTCRDLMKRQPAVGPALWKSATDRIKEAGYSRRNPLNSELIQFSLDHGVVQGNSVLVIDLSRCTRCDDCVRGCAEEHGGRARFVREGERYQNFLIARACYHCEDPTCLIGCPTGAIRRARDVGAVVEIDDDICIGCSNCANKCPYDAIIMHPTGETWSESAIPSWNRGKPQLVASKCDLCYHSDAGPACVNSCPQGCAVRIQSLEEFKLDIAGGT